MRMNSFDIVVLTAANEAQAAGYREQTAWRRDSGLLPQRTRCMVIPDPGGRRVGSLGSTLFVLTEVARQLLAEGAAASFSELFRGRRIVICHSGGDSRRTPAYTAQGKVFTPVPARSARGAPLALFDLIHETLSRLPMPAEGHVLVTSGDVLLTFDHASVDFSRPGVTGVAYFGSVERGSRHGVYVPAAFKGGASRTECLPVADFLQKPRMEEMQRAGAVDGFGHVAIDTGLVSFGPQMTELLLTACGVGLAGGSRVAIGRGLLRDVISGGAPVLDLYEELLMAVTPSFTAETYGERCGGRAPGAAHKRRLDRFFRGVHGSAFNVNILPYCEFFHIGSSRELLAGFSGLSRTAQEYGFANGSGAVLTRAEDGGNAFVFNSFLNAPLASGRALIEAVHRESGGGLALEGDNIVTGVPGSCTLAIRLPSGIGLVCLPLGREQWAAIVYGIDDDFKTACGAARECLFLNQPVEDWLTRTGAGVKQLWRGDERDGMWSARLWRTGEIDDVVGEALTIAAGGGFAQQCRGRRYSIAELLPRINHRRLLEMCREVLREVGVREVARRLREDDTLAAADICRDIRSGRDAHGVLGQLAAVLESCGGEQPLFKARVLKLASLIYNRWPDAGIEVCPGIGGADSASAAAFGEISRSVARSYTPRRVSAPAAILHDQVVWVTTPVRIDFAGGWSDTPPICTELGGMVLNAAVTLNGLYPVQVMAKLNTRHTIRLSSIDLGERRELINTAEVLDHHDPSDWSALAKAALILSGIVPDSPRESLKACLERLGGGLDLTIFSALPKGSGMGTSSILGAAVLACLDRVLGLPFSADRLIFMTSMLEQRMSTGGGWQDQVGGILPGVKLIRTEPGADQSVSLRWSLFDSESNSEIRQRCLLYYTGQKRMARNILQNVVGGYLARDPVILRTIHDLKICAAEAKEALDARDIEAFAACINRYWELKKRIDPGSTNRPIERLLNSVKAECSAALLPGAGGGGFIFMIAGSVESAARIRAKFARRPPNGQARFFDFDVDRQGLKVTVL